LGEGEGEDRVKEVMEGIETIVKERCEGYSGANFAALVREAGVITLRKNIGALDEMDDGTHEEDRRRQV